MLLEQISELIKVWDTNSLDKNLHAPRYHHLPPATGYLEGQTMPHPCPLSGSRVPQIMLPGVILGSSHLLACQLTLTWLPCTRHHFLRPLKQMQIAQGREHSTSGAGTSRSILHAKWAFHTVANYYWPELPWGRRHVCICRNCNLQVTISFQKTWEKHVGDNSYWCLAIWVLLTLQVLP